MKIEPFVVVESVFGPPPNENSCRRLNLFAKLFDITGKGLSRDPVGKKFLNPPQKRRRNLRNCYDADPHGGYNNTRPRIRRLPKDQPPCGPSFTRLQPPSAQPSRPSGPWSGRRCRGFYSEKIENWDGKNWCLPVKTVVSSTVSKCGQNLCGFLSVLSQIVIF